MATPQQDWFSQNAPPSAGGGDWFASNAPGAQPQQLPDATIGAAPSRSPAAYLQDVQSDLTQGGNRTFVGQALGYLQGKGDQGYAGLQSGVSPEQAQMMGSVPLGVTKMALGTTQLPSQPLRGAGNILGGALQTATLPASFVAPEASEAAGQAAQAVANKVVPSQMKAQAAGLLQSVAHDANQVPVQLTNAGDAALNLIDWQKTTNLGPTINKFLNRVTSPKLGPMTYEEARDFYQILGNLSANEKLNLAPPVKRDVVQLLTGLKQDIGDAADTVGRAQDYFAGMQDYASASRYQEWLDSAKDFLAKDVVQAGIKGAGLTAGGGAIYKAWQWMQGK